MTPAVRNHLMQVLADAGIPENLLAELMKERRGLRDSLVQAALSAVIAQAGQGPHQFVVIAKDAYAIADAVLSLRDRSPSYKPETPVTADPHALEHATQMQAARKALSSLLDSATKIADACDSGDGADDEIKYFREIGEREAMSWLIADSSAVPGRVRLIGGAS